MQAVTDNNGDTGARGESMQMFTDQEAGPLTMSKVSIKKNFILNLLLRVTRVTIPLITFPYVSRILQPEGLGRVTFAESFIAYLILIAQLGVPTYGIRACARVRDDREKLSRTVHELVAINLLMSLLAYAILIICMMKVPRIGNDREIFVIFSINIVMGAVGMDWMYEGLEQYSYITVRTLTLRLVSVILIFLLIHRPEQAPLYAGIVVFSVSGPQLVNLIHARKYIALRPVGRYHLSPHMKAALIFFLMAGITAVYTSLDKVMLGFIAGDAPVGYYSVAVKVKNVLFLCISALAAVLLPRSSYYVGTGRMEAQRKLSNKALNYVFIVSLSLALFFFLYTEESVLFLSGKNYVPAVLPMKIIMPGVGLIGLTNVFTTQVLIPIGKEKQVLSANVAGAVIDVLLNLMLIPKYGAVGAAVGTLAAEIGVFCTLLYYGRRHVDLHSVEYRKIIPALLLAGLAGWVFRIMEMNAFLKLLLASGVFFGVYGTVLIVTKEKLTMEVAGLLKIRFRNRAS